MLKKVTVGLCSICITLIMVITSVTGSIQVQAYANSPQLSDVVSAKDKISLNLSTVMQESNADDKIPVWVWFTDINQEDVDKKVKKDTGLTAEDVAVSFEDVPNELINALDDNFDENTDEQQINQTFEALQKYVENTDEQRTQEQINADTYNKARREIARNAYMEQNCELIDELSLPENEITFQSQLTPSIIVNLTKDQILNTARAKEVVSIDYYEEPDELSPLNTRDEERSTMRADAVQKVTGLTGKGINVIVFDGGWIRADAGCYDHVNSNNVHVVYNKALYTVNDTSVLPSGELSSHPNFVAGTMQAFAKDVNIFSVGRAKYADLEWAVLNCNIDLINGSITLGAYSSYSSDAPAKWLDALVSTNNITLIASGGNDEAWWPKGWPDVISPASGYNCIATGAYYFDIIPNKMYDYRYNPIDSTTQVNYKPDIIVAAGSTSEASPMVSGIVSMMIQLKPSLAANPELIKSILMASCHRKVESVEGFPSESMTDGLTQRQGAGAIDAYNAISIVLQGKYGVSEISSGATDIVINESLTNGNINVSIAWLRNNTYTSTYLGSASLGTLQELELEVLDNNYNVVGMSARKNTGKQMVYFPTSSNDGKYTIRVTKESQNSESVRFAYAWSNALDNEDAIIRKSVSLNNALSNHSLGFETDVLFDDIVTNGNITEHQLLGVTSDFNNSHITVDGASLFSFGDIHLLDLPNDYSGTYQLQNGASINYNVSKDNGDILITVYDSSSIYVDVNDYADAFSYYTVQNNHLGKDITTRYTNPSYIARSNQIHINFYDKNENWFTDTSQASFNERVGYISGIDAAYKLSCNNVNERAIINLATYEMGDVTLDGIVDEDDSTTLLRYVAEFYSFIQTGSTSDLTLGNGNITVNGNISANGMFTLNASNANINGQLSASTFVNNITGNLNMNKPQNNLIFTSDYVQALFSDDRMNSMYFNDDSVNIISSDYNINDTNILLSSDTIVDGDASLTGNVTINSNFKATGDILINGDVSNTINGVIYSQNGDVTLNSSNVNYNGFIYAPNGTVTIEGNNITITGTIIAKELVIDGNTVNFNVAAINQDTSGDIGSSLTLTEFQLMLGDVNYDKEVNVVDVVIVNQKVFNFT